MKKLLFVLLIWIIPLLGSANINEYLTDVYFANGILTDEGNATANTTLLRNAIIEQYGSLPEMKKHIGKVKEAYNNTHGLIPDLGESFNQILNETFGNPVLLVSKVRYLFNELVSVVENADLKLQVDKYEASIKNGHKVLAVAHSQGNLFTKKAYDQLFLVPTFHVGMPTAITNTMTI